MKKRCMTVLLAIAVLLACLPGAGAAGGVCFIAVNDSIPHTLSKEASPFYYNNRLYIPYTAYDANPANVVVSKNTSENSLALFTRNQRLVYDLDQNTVMTEAHESRPAATITSNGILFLPAEDAAHFGLSVTLLYSQSGYPIIRFTNGSHVYSDALFVEKAENFIQHTLKELQQGLLEDPVQNPDSPDPDDPGSRPGGEEPATIYLAFAGAAVSQKTLELLNRHDLTAAFFLTREQFETKPELLQAIYASGHTVGITAPVDSTDLAGDLKAANEAMDQVLFCKSLLALVPQEQGDAVQDYIPVLEPLVTPTMLSAEKPVLLVCRTDMTSLIESLIKSGASLPQLRETTRLPEPEIPAELPEETEP